MPHESPFDERVYREWEDLTMRGDLMAVDEMEARAKRLYDSCFAEGAWNVAVMDAALVTGLGVKVALQSMRYPEAVEIARRYLERPDAHTDEASWDHLRCRLGSALILSGAMSEGLDTLSHVLRAAAGPLAYRQVIVRNELLAILSLLGEKATTPANLKAFISNLFSGWEGHREKAQSAASATQNEEFYRLLDSTYPAR